MDIHQLARDEPLSPELVLVLPPELRAQALARLGPPAWMTPRPPVAAAAPRPAATETAPLAVAEEASAPPLGAMLVARVGQLALVFVAVTILVLVMSIVANAMR